MTQLSTVSYSPLQRMLLSLDGLSVGDAFGQRFFGHPDDVSRRLMQQIVPDPVWRYTDDTEMTLAIVELVAERETIDQDKLARMFARRYMADPMRGYGGGAHTVLQSIAAGSHWRPVAAALFDGTGSMGNGAAMRSGPIGAYFAGDTERIVLEAARSAQVTHAHPDAQAGAVAVALAVGWAWEHGEATTNEFAAPMLLYVLEHTPDGATRDGIKRALTLAHNASVGTAVALLGNGSNVLSSDTVPFALWSAAQCMWHFERALWNTVRALGDRDTTCAMVGAIVGVSSSRTHYRSDISLKTNAISQTWLNAREPLALKLQRAKT
jgi:ADP-ribosylglycohydrolase